MNRIQSLARKLRFPLREIHVIPGRVTDRAFGCVSGLVRMRSHAHGIRFYYSPPLWKNVVICDRFLESGSPVEVKAVRCKPVPHEQIAGHELGHWCHGESTSESSLDC